MILSSFYDSEHAQTVILPLYHSEHSPNHKNPGKITKIRVLSGIFSPNARISGCTRIYPGDLGTLHLSNLTKLVYFGTLLMIESFWNMFKYKTDGQKSKHGLRTYCRCFNLSRLTRFWGDQPDHKGTGYSERPGKVMKNLGGGICLLYTEADRSQCEGWQVECEEQTGGMGRAIEQWCSCIGGRSSLNLHLFTDPLHWPSNDHQNLPHCMAQLPPHTLGFGVLAAISVTLSQMLWGNFTFVAGVSWCAPLVATDYTLE